MSEQKSQRSKEEIQNEYKQLAFKAGNLHYSITQNQRDLDTMFEAMRELNFEFVEAGKLEAAAQEAPKAE